MRVLSGKGDRRGKSMVNRMDPTIKRRSRMHDAMGDVKDQFADWNRENQSPENPGNNGRYIILTARNTSLFVICMGQYGEDWSSEEFLRYQVYGGLEEKADALVTKYH